jgi:stress response protein SCP2
MDIQVVSKGESFPIADKAGKPLLTNLYIGAGWDMGDKPVDLDLVAACLSNGQLTAPTRLVYFGDRTEPGVTLSEDNTSGAGDGDDESILIDLSKVETDVDSIAIGVAAYAGADLTTAKNFHFRIVDGTKSTDTQLFDVKTDNATAGDTVLHAATLKRTSTGWTVESVSAFYKKGNGADAIKGFAGLFTAQAAQAA